MQINDALDLFYLDCQARRLTPSTITFYKLKVGDFSRWLQGRDITDVTAITSTDIKRYLVHLQERGLNDTSQHDYARAVKTFLNYCVRDELLDRSPFDKVKMPQQEQRLPVVLTDDEVRRALHMVKPQRNRLIVRFILDSGVRAAELLALNVGDIEMATGVVVVRLGKQQKERLTAIGGRTRKEVKRYLIERGHPSSHEPLIASTTTGARLSMPGLMGAFRKMQGQTGIDHLTAHALRRTMATRAMENGANEYILARMLGHSDLQMLKRYVAVSRRMVEEAGAQFSVVDNL
ncbi:MAG: tyrosine-type recombinase/integrase [Caldilineaceae bacterium]